MALNEARAAVMVGNVPGSWGIATLLSRLEDNRLDGPVPSELGSLMSLLVLRLNANKLAGALPTTLLSLTQLGPYPLSLVGVPSDEVSNTLPPKLPLLALAAAHGGHGVNGFQTGVARFVHALTGDNARGHHFNAAEFLNGSAH